MQGLTNIGICAQLADGLTWAVNHGADVINNSWGDAGGTIPNITNSIYSAILHDALDNAMTNGRNGLGCILVFAAGNQAAINYPANYSPEIICVGSIDSNGVRMNTNNVFQSAVGNQLDVVAPGVDIVSTFPGGPPIGPTYTNSGTSFAAPYVSGLAALLISTNPCLTSQQIQNIIEQTSQKASNYNYSNTSGRPNGTWNNETGYGLIDAYAAVQMAQSIGLNNLDLMIKDGVVDTGIEPNLSSFNLWSSNDIWIRNLPDGLQIQEHQNPIYNISTPNYAYVRVKNNSCVASTGSEQLKFYWAKAGSGLSWPNSWDGNHYFPAPNQTKKQGALVDTVTIPTILAGQETILQIPFIVPNPTDYAFIGSEQWHFCLLARIESTLDPLVETIDLYTNVQNNNCIAWKNITIVTLPEPSPLINVEIIPEAAIAVGNPFHTPKTFKLEFIKEDLETGKAIYDEAEVSVKMDQTLYNAWERGGKIAQQIDETIDVKRKIVKGNHVLLNNIAFNADEIGTLSLRFNFLIAQITNKTKFLYHVIQKDAQTGAIIGGETFVIKKPIRQIFVADAGDTKEVDKNEAITISAIQISEPAIYKWYDTDGNLIFTGKDLTIATQVATKYKLEVIATADGFKDYSEVEVNLKPSILNLITPNPASGNVNISYKLNSVGSAYLMIIGSYGTTGITNNYILDTNSSETNINISSYPNGFYTVALICNGQIVDAKTLIKQ